MHPVYCCAIAAQTDTLDDFKRRSSEWCMCGNSCFKGSIVPGDVLLGVQLATCWETREAT